VAIVDFEANKLMLKIKAKSESNRIFAQNKILGY